MSEKEMSFADRVRKRAETHNSSSGNYLNLPSKVDWFKPEDGQMKFDILPYIVSDKNNPEKVPVGQPWYERTFFIHTNVGAGDKRMLCPKSVGKPCPICEKLGEMQADTDADEKIMKALKPKQRQLFNVLHKGSIKLWDFSYHNFGKQLEKEIKDGDESLCNFATLKSGKTLKVRFTETTMGKNKFFEADRIDFLDREEPLSKELMEEVHDLDTLLVAPTYEELQAEFLELDAPDADETETPAKKKPAADDEDEPKPKKKPAAADDDLDYGPSKKKPAADEDEPEPAPKKKPAAEEAPEPEVGDRVKWEYKGEEHTGTVKKLMGEGAIRVVDDENSDLVKVVDAGDYEILPAKKKPAADEDEPAPSKRRNPPPDDDADTPPKKKPAADEDKWPDDEDEPKPSRRTK